MQVRTHRSANLAAYRISQEGFESAERDRLLLHEVIHCLLDPVREEFDFAMVELRNEGQLEAKRERAYRARHDREVEKVVEHLSHVMYDVVPTPS